MGLARSGSGCGRRMLGPFNLVAEWIHFTLFGDNNTHYKTDSVHCLGLMNSATKFNAKGPKGL